MQKVKIAVLVSGGGTNLQAVLDAQKSGVLKSGEVEKQVSRDEIFPELIRSAVMAASCAKQ